MTNETDLTELNIFFQPTTPLRKASVVKTRCGYQLTYWHSANSFRVMICKTRKEAKTIIEQSGIAQSI